MTYQTVSSGSVVQTLNGNAKIRVRLDKLPRSQQYMDLRIDIPDYVGDELATTQSPVWLLQDSNATGLLREYVITGAVVFPNDSFLTSREILITPCLRNDHQQILSQGQSFAVTMQRGRETPQAPARILDLPFTDSLFRFWDVRDGLTLPTSATSGEWKDQTIGDPIQLKRLLGQRLTLEQPRDTRHKMQSLRFQHAEGGDFFGLLGPTADGLRLPPSWTILVTGYPRRDWTTISAGDQLFGYTNHGVSGPYEGIYRSPLPNDHLGFSGNSAAIRSRNWSGIMQTYAVTSDPVLQDVDAFVNGSHEGSDMFDSLSVGRVGNVGGHVRSLFPYTLAASSVPRGADFQLAQILIFSRRLSDNEIMQFNTYANGVWYK